jgi:dTDP-4-amino-4,6-dideoxygalactose transaminase
MPEIDIPIAHDDRAHAYHLYVIRLSLDKLDIDRAQFIEELRALNIGSSVHFIPVHLHPWYQKAYGYKRGDFPVAERVFDSIISLPLYPKMSEDDLQDVVEAVRYTVKQHGRR